MGYMNEEEVNIYCMTTFSTDCRSQPLCCLWPPASGGAGRTTGTRGRRGDMGVTWLGWTWLAQLSYTVFMAMLDQVLTLLFSIVLL